jgi:Uma2 family endonuclease
MPLKIEHQLTLNEFLSLPSNEGDTIYELVDGQISPKMSPQKFHSRLTRTLMRFLEDWCQERGEVCPELAIALTRNGKDWAPVPELLYLSAERFPSDWDSDGICSVPPDLVIEIISPGQTFGQLAAKAKDYLDANVLRVWIVDSQAKSITVFYPDSPPQTYVGDTVLIDPRFEGLVFTPQRIFQKAKIL